MNAMNVVPKTIELAPARTALVSSVTWRTNDDPFNRKLVVVVNNLVTITVAGAEYDALGQWTDDTIKGLILARFALEPA